MSDEPDVDEPIERAAMAIRNAFGDRLGRGRSWEILPDRLKAAYRGEAKAAITAFIAAGGSISNG